MSAKRTPEKIAANLAKTPRGRNVLALLLRLADGDGLRAPVSGVMQAAKDAEENGLGHGASLTSIGRSVAEACRPKPWTAVATEVKPDMVCVLVSPDGDDTWHVGPHAERIAALLTADDLARAKRFNEVPT